MSKPIISIIIPSFNGAKDINKSIHSIINERIYSTGVYKYFEIIFINDGSTDNTKEVIKNEQKFWNNRINKNFLRVINKTNGQYGSVINRGIKEARGHFFKVLDVDDSFSTESFIKIIYILKGILDKNVDVVFTDHSFEKVASNTKIIQSLSKYLESYKVKDISTLTLPKDIVTMHSIIYRTNLLREIKYKQVEGVYYSDSQFSLIPLLSAKKYYYASLTLYRYYIGSDEQSININSMVKNKLDQQRVMYTIIKELDFNNIKHKNLRKYATIVIRRLMQWRLFIIINDDSITNKRKEIINTFRKVKARFPNEYRMITSGRLFFFIKASRAFGISTLMRFGIKLYARFKKNIMSNWD